VEKDNSFRKAFYHLQMSTIYFEDVTRESSNSIAGKLSKNYIQKLNWIKTDFKTTPQLPKYAIEDFQKDLNGDIMFHESISRKALGLSEKQKATLEHLIDCLIIGEEITVKISNDSLEQKHKTIYHK